MGKIQGYIGELDEKNFSILQVAVQGKRRKAEARKKYIAIERYKKTSGEWVYIETPIPDNTLGQPDKIREYLKDKSRTLGRLTQDATNWTQGTQNTQTKQKAGYKPAARARIKTDFNVLIGGDLHHKTQPKIRQIIRQGEAANEEFFKTILA